MSLAGMLWAASNLFMQWFTRCQGLSTRNCGMLWLYCRYMEQYCTFLSRYLKVKQFILSDANIICGILRKVLALQWASYQPTECTSFNFFNVWALQLLNRSVALVLHLCPCNPSKTTQHFIFVIADAVDPPLPCLFMVEFTKKNLATCPKRIKRDVSKCYVKLKCMYIFNLNSQFAH